MIPNRKSRFLLFAVCISIFALALRVTASLMLLAADKMASAPPATTDMATYLSLSGGILKGEFPDIFYYQPFYYAVFLPAAQIFAGGASPLMIALAQSLCGAAAVFLCALTGGMLGGRKTGYLAALLMAFCQMAVIYTPYALIATTQSLWFSLLLYLTMLAVKRRSTALWICAGLALSAAILTRGNAWCFLPAMLFLCAYSLRRNRKKAAVASLLMLAAAILPQLPFAITNTVATGRVSGPSTAGSNVLALGNTPEAPAGGLEYPLSYEIWSKEASRHPVPERILEWFIEEPGAFLELQIRKTFLFWDAYDIPNNIDPGRTAALLPFGKCLIPTGIILFLGLSGMFMLIFRGAFKGKTLYLAPVLFIVLYNLAAAAFYILGRFRIPLLPVLCAAGAYGVFAAASGIRVKKRKTLIVLGASALTAFCIVYHLSDVYKTAYTPAVMRLVRPHGVDIATDRGTRLVYDRGPRSYGGYVMASSDTEFLKRFNPKEEVREGAAVIMTIPFVKGPAHGGAIILNGVAAPVNGYAAGANGAVSFNVRYPENGVFHIYFKGLDAVFPVVDTQRDYHRTMIHGKNGFSEAPFELALEMEYPDPGHSATTKEEDR